jgi:indole-3-glycerol phosphate synthase
MKNILDKIIETKRIEVANLKEVAPESTLKEGKYFSRTCHSMKERLLQANGTGIIAEFKQKSPSKGEINYAVKVEEVTRAYSEAGAVGLSVLTDYEYFGGSVINLVKARDANPATPILRKDFMIDPYQITEAKAFGADVILLIAACLKKEEVNQLAAYAKNLGLEVLLEIHDESELDKISPLVDMVGVNNRNLKTFEVSVENSIRLAKLIPASYVKISESGLSSPETIIRLKSAGFSGYLIGETFMKTADPGKACRELIDKLREQ